VAAAEASPAGVSQNNNSNVDGVLSRLLSNFLHGAHGLLLKTASVHARPVEVAACYALESAIDLERLRKKAKKVWIKRRSSLFMALRRPWR